MKQIRGYESGDNQVLDEHTDIVTSKPRPANNKDQRSTNQEPSIGFFSTEKNPEKARGLQVPTTEKYIFNFFDPPAFCTKKQEARGLHSMSVIFCKIALAVLKGKELGGHQDRKTL